MLLVTEIFHSIQGEGTAVGLPFVFVRLTGCNLRCTYCDSAYAFKGGTRMSLNEVTETVARYSCKDVLLTGGEPLMQRGTVDLCRTLVSKGFRLSIETHGEVDLSNVKDYARLIMDIKTPGSGMSRGGFERNLRHLKTSDEIKFVLTSKSDYEWARELVKSRKLPTQTVLFSPAQPALQQPGNFEGIDLQWLAEQILKDSLPVRLQVQLHKIIWGPNKPGV